MEKMKNETKAALLWGALCVVVLVVCCMGDLGVFIVAMAVATAVNFGVKIFAPGVHKEMWRVGDEE